MSSNTEEERKFVIATITFSEDQTKERWPLRRSPITSEVDWTMLVY
jgi:hypothetical protein